MLPKVPNSTHEGPGDFCLVAKATYGRVDESSSMSRFAALRPRSKLRSATPKIKRANAVKSHTRSSLRSQPAAKAIATKGFYQRTRHQPQSRSKPVHESDCWQTLQGAKESLELRACY